MCETLNRYGYKYLWKVVGDSPIHDRHIECVQYLELTPILMSNNIYTSYLYM
jgi:hypothetical protein